MEAAPREIDTVTMFSSLPVSIFAGPISLRESRDEDTGIRHATRPKLSLAF